MTVDTSKFTPAEVLKFAEENGCTYLDIRFMDMPGLWHHYSFPITMLTEEKFETGFGFDGSSMRGWKSIHDSDMLVIPDPTTAFIDPFMEERTLVLIADVYDPITKEDFARDPRNIAKRAEAYLKSTGIADTCYIGPECEFFVFDDIRYNTSINESYFHIDSDEGSWNSGRKEEGGNLGYKPRTKGGYFPCPPVDSLHDMRGEMTTIMQQIGIIIECHHHEVATGGQCEIDMRFDSLVRMADKVMKYKNVVKNVANRWGKTATFMPKPLYGDNGTGMHCHLSLWKGGKNLFSGDKYAGMSDTGLYAIGGILKHAHAILAISNPTTNSYRRLVPGYEAPVRLAYSSRNRSASIRIPMFDSSPKAKRFEFRCPDPSSNPYLVFAALCMAVIDGIQNRIDPGQPLDKDIYDLPPEEAKNVPSTPATLAHALEALEADHEWLTRGGVFSEDLINAWISYKRKHEVEAMALRPHPYEFNLYFDC